MTEEETLRTLFSESTPPGPAPDLSERIMRRIVTRKRPVRRWVLLSVLAIPPFIWVSHMLGSAHLGMAGADAGNFLEALGGFIRGLELFWIPLVVLALLKMGLDRRQPG